MITFVVVCLGFLIVLALLAPVIDAMGASGRRNAADRRRVRWQVRRGYLRHGRLGGTT